MDESSSDGVKRAMPADFKKQRKEQAASFTAELSAKIRTYNGEWERRMEAASSEWAKERDKLVSELDESRITQYHLESRVESLEQTLREWGSDENEAWWQEE